MKMKMKKMMAILLILTMIAGIWGVLPNTAKASTAVSTGTLTLYSSGSDTSYYYIFLSSANEMPFTYGEWANSVSNSGGMLRNGVVFSGSTTCVTEGDSHRLRWNIPKSNVDLKAGDELKIFGTFKSTGDEDAIEIIPTVVRCKSIDTSSGKASWELVSSEEEVAEKEFLTLKDFFTAEQSSYGDTWIYGSCRILQDSTNQIYGKTYKEFVSWGKKVLDTYEKPTILYYGCGTNGGNTGIGVAVSHIADNQNEISVLINRAGVKTYSGNTLILTDEELQAENLLEIDFPEQGENDTGYLSVRLNGVDLVENYEITEVSYFQNYIHFAIDNADYSMTNKKYTEERALNYNMNHAPEITALDFGIQDGSYQEAKSGTLDYALNGKKFIIEYGRNEVSTPSLFLYYGDLYYSLRTSDNLFLHYTNGTSAYVTSGRVYSTTAANPATLEIYMEYVDADSDGIKDDARFATRLQGGLLTSDTYYTDTYWFYQNDGLYTIKPTLSLQLQDNAEGTYWIESQNTHASATLNNGVLTVSGTGKVVPSVVNAVVTADNAGDVTQIQIADGITEVAAGVFKDCTNLQMVSYSDSVVSVSDTAFTGCAENVKVVCPEGQSFTGGLENPIMVQSFTFEDLDETRSGKDNSGLVVAIKPSVVIKGNAAEGTTTAASTYTGLQVDINGTISEVTLTKTSYGTLAFTIPTDQLPVAESYTIVIKSGVLSAEDNATVSYGLREDYIIYVNAAGISGNQYVTDCGTVSPNYMSNSGNYAGAFYISTTDKMPTGSVAVAEDTPDSGIFLNGEKFSAVLTKMGDTYYYLSIQGNNDFRNVIVQQGLDKERHAKDGDVITICGTFRSGDSVVTFNPLSVRYNSETNWEVITASDSIIELPSVAIDMEATGVGYTVGAGTVSVKVGNDVKDITDGTSLYLPGDYVVTRTIGDISYKRSVSLYRKGDVNIDNSLNIQDLIAMKKCQDDSTDYSEAQKSATVVVESGVDTDNATELRKALVGDSEVITETKDGADLPVELAGQQLGNATMQEDANFADTFITSVSATANGTVVFGMSDTLAEAPYASTESQMAKFDDFGLDYVIDVEGGERELKVLQITDTQIIDYNMARTEERKSQVPNVYVESNKQALLTNYLEQTIQAADPDLILMTGDNIFGEFDDEGDELKWLIETMDSYGILWAPIFGNHDNESRMGVLWQCEQFQESKYCLFNRRHSIGGNGNYTIGLAKDGELKRTIFMMDTHECAVAYNDSEYPDTAQLSHPTTGRFVWQQMVWYREMAKRINCVAETTIPSFMAYHIPTKDVYEAEIVAGYRTEDSPSEVYSIGNGENQVSPAQLGDCGAMQSSTQANLKTVDMLTYMNEVGTDGAFFGHQHTNSASIYYGGVRWTYGVKTGMYDTHPEDELGGTLITLSDDCKDFAISQILINCIDDLCAGKH